MEETSLKPISNESKNAHKILVLHLKKIVYLKISIKIRKKNSDEMNGRSGFYKRLKFHRNFYVIILSYRVIHRQKSSDTILAL